jgi:hypothetical protein
LTSLLNSAAKTASASPASHTHGRQSPLARRSSRWKPNKKNSAAERPVRAPRECYRSRESASAFEINSTLK